MGWDRSTARQVKAQAAQRAGELLAGYDVEAAPRLGGVALVAPPGAATVGIAVGLSPVGDGSYRLAVRYRLGTPTARMVCRRLAEELGPEVDVRHTGRVQALAARPVPAARSVGETGRVRPLRPGISVAHVAVTAGTLGGFVEVEGTPYLLSNYHVLVGDSGRVGDPVLQPGPADGGADPEDRIGSLASFVPLRPGEPATVDAALADLADVEFDAVYPVGALTGVVDADGGEQVEKSGRTTGITQGLVTAIELDGVLVNFGPGLGVLSFDNQVEVESAGNSPFSLGGDSGSLVYRPESREALGLLFAGSDQGGSNGLGLTYLNPVTSVLQALGAELHKPDDSDDPGDPEELDDPDPDEEPPEHAGCDREHRVPGCAGQAMIRSRAEARRVKTALRQELGGVPGIAGVGLVRQGDGYAVVVNVSDLGVIAELPDQVRSEAHVHLAGEVQAR